MSRKATGLQGYLASAERAFALLDEQPDVPERPHARPVTRATGAVEFRGVRSEEHTSELQSRSDLVCRLLLEKKKKTMNDTVCRPTCRRSRQMRGGRADWTL